MLGSRFILAATIAALAGCAAAPTTSPQGAAPVLDRTVAAAQAPEIRFSQADLEKMRKLIPDKLTAEQARTMLIEVDPAQLQERADRSVQGRRGRGFGRGFGHGFGRGFGHGFGHRFFGGFGRGLGFSHLFPFSYGGYSLYWPYSLIGSSWYPYGVSPWYSWLGSYWPSWGWW